MLGALTQVITYVVPFLLVLTAILHIALHGSGDPMALVVNAVLLATGLAPARRRALLPPGPLR